MTAPGRDCRPLLNFQAAHAIAKVANILYALSMIDVHKEKLMRFSECSQLPGNPHPRTVEHWCKVGVRHKSTGRYISMEFEVIGGCNFTSIEAFDRWRAKLNEGLEK